MSVVSVVMAGLAAVHFDHISRGAQWKLDIEVDDLVGGQVKTACAHTPRTRWR